jgi:hypothetical protein
MGTLRESTNIMKLLDFTGTVRSAKAQATEVVLKFADKEIKVVLTFAEVVLLMQGLGYAASLEGTSDQKAGA